MNNPLVSVNIPVYKSEKYILRCLESVKNQDYKNIEIILVNDCTPDDSIRIIEKFISDNCQLSVLLIHHNENSGLSVVRNTGINNSNGKYIYFLDSDDDITNDCIEKLVVCAEKDNTDLVIAQNRWINTFDNSIKDYGFPTNSNQKLYTSNDKIFEDYCLNAFPVSSWNKLIRVDFIKKNKTYFIPGLYAQDELWMFHIMEKINSLSIIDDITYNYYLHKDSVIFNRTKKNSENHQTILEWITKSYNATKDKKRKELIKKWIINFKTLIIQMQWKILRDKDYFKQNYIRMKKAPSLTFIDYFSSRFNKKEKKENLLLNLPAEVGFKIFKKRYGDSN